MSDGLSPHASFRRNALGRQRSRDWAALRAARTRCGLFLAITSVAIASTLAGCDAFGPRSGRGPGSTWPFQPATMRIHPLTRFVASGDSGPPTLETHLEFRDVDGVDTRAIGTLRLTLAARGPLEPSPLTWTLDLDSLPTNRRHFDQVTQTYVVPLAIDWPPLDPTTTVVLRVSLERQQSPTLSADATLPWPEAAPATGHP